MAATDMGEEEVARFSDLMYESPAHIQKCRDHDDDEPRPEEDWRLRKGESLQQCSQRLLKDLKYSNTDRFNFIFYELFFPSFMEKKRMKAYHLGKPLNAHYEREFAECERMEIPYSRELRAFLGEHKSIKSYMEARKVKSPLHNPDKSLQHRFWYACQTGAEDEEIFSLADKVDINARDATYFNFSGLDFAIERNHSAVAEMIIMTDPTQVLLALDIDHDSLNGFNLTAFDFAFFAENLRVMDAITWTSMLKKRRFEFESGLVREERGGQRGGENKESERGGWRGGGVMLSTLSCTGVYYE
eukprot:768743-Hanusia_phi.AAC.3